jgi:hypothetical protein
MTRPPIDFGEDRPLKVRVSECLGWTDCYEMNGVWFGVNPTGHRAEVPAYGETWCSTGPLVERFGFGLGARPTSWDASYSEEWFANGQTPCKAVALLIVELHKEGKLKA